MCIDFVSCRSIGASVLVMCFALTAEVNSQEKARGEGKKAAAQDTLDIALDPSFGTGGMVAELLDPKAQIGALGRFLTVDRQGRPVIAGNAPGQRFAVGRYLGDGKRDASFAGKGKTSVCIEDDATVESAAGSEVQFTHGGAIDAKGRIV